MKLLLLALNYNLNTLISFNFLDLATNNLTCLDTQTTRSILLGKGNQVFGLGMNSFGTFYGTNGKLDRYTKLTKFGVLGKESFVVVARDKDTYTISSAKGNLTKLKYWGIIDLLGIRGIANGKVNSKGFISPLRGDFGGDNIERRKESNVRRRSQSLDRNSQGKERETGNINSVRSSSTKPSTSRQRGNRQRNRELHFYDGLSSDVSNCLKSSGLNLSTKPVSFKSYIEEAKTCNRHGACVDVHPLDEYESMSCLSFDKGKAGVAVHNGNITSVFKHDKSSIKGFIKVAMVSAIANGGNKLDCYAIEGGLSDMYAQCGMIPACKVAFNKDFAPSDWNYKLYGEPNIVFMLYCGDHPNTMYAKYGSYKPYVDYTEDEVPLIKDTPWVCAYDIALAVRDFRLAQLKIKRRGKL